MSEILNRKERCARKTHHCELCDGEIHPGESYIYTACVYDGSAYSFKQHIHCEALAERYYMAMGTDEYNSDDVHDWAQEEVCSECDKWADGCEHTALTCPKVLKALLPSTLLPHEQGEGEEMYYEKDKD